MRRGWLLVLLISLGLNVGLGYRMIASRPCAGSPGLRGCSMRDTGPDRVGPQGMERHSGGRSFAGGDSSRWHNLAKVRISRITEKLALSDNQTAALRESHRQVAGKSWEQRRRIEAARLRLHEAVVMVPVDSDTIRQAIHALAGCQAVMDSLITEALLAEMDLLEPEQRSLYLEMLPLDRSGMRGRSAGFGHKGRGRGKNAK